MKLGHRIEANGKEECDPEYLPPWLICECGSECVLEIVEKIRYQVDRAERQSEVDGDVEDEVWWCNECREQVREPEE